MEKKHILFAMVLIVCLLMIYGWRNEKWRYYEDFVSSESNNCTQFDFNIRYKQPAHQVNSSESADNSAKTTNVKVNMSIYETGECNYKININQHQRGILWKRDIFGYKRLTAGYLSLYKIVAGYLSLY